MAATKSTRPAAALPRVSVARVEEVGKLIERLVAEKTSVFAEAQGAYREQVRNATSRPLTAAEAGQLAAVWAEQLGGDPVDLAERLQQSGLRAMDEPDPADVLWASGAATAPAFIDAALQVVALVELDDGLFNQAREDDTLDDEITTGVTRLRELDAVDARDRARAAFEHFSAKGGFPPGEALRLLTGTVTQALTDALKTSPSIGSRLSSLINSDENWAGPGTTASTGPEPAMSGSTST